MWLSPRAGVLLSSGRHAAQLWMQLWINWLMVKKDKRLGRSEEKQFLRSGFRPGYGVLCHFHCNVPWDDYTDKRSEAVLASAYSSSHPSERRVVITGLSFHRILWSPRCVMVSCPHRSLHLCEGPSLPPRATSETKKEQEIRFIPYSHSHAHGTRTIQDHIRCPKFPLIA